MQYGSRLFRLGLLWLASTSLSLTGPIAAFAQPAPPPGQPMGVPDAQGSGGDPPALAGRLTDLQGTVSYHPAGADQWSPASQNFPVTSGNAYWTEPQASATIEIGDDQIVMDGGTELDVTTLDQSQFVASSPQGAIFLGLRDLPDGQALTVTTPRGAVQITQPGAYEIVAGDTNDPTSVTVVNGAAHITGAGVDLNVTAQQTATIAGADTFQGSVGAMAQDQFLSAQLQHFQPPRPAQAPPPQVAQQVRYMTGGSSLAQYGSWSENSSYGQVWYPSNVGADWAPYRNGHWAYVQPWGWNWVDDEPWGFAPFHYGRWINDGGRWGWVAGGGDAYGGGYPVYAPALVSFVGFEPGVLGGVGFGLGVGFGVGVGVGWFPLGYREAYVPWYHASDAYFRGVNRYSVRDYRNLSINNYRNITINNYHNARFATVAPGGAFASGARLDRIARPLPAGALARARPVVGRLPVAPTAHTPGLSRAVAASYHVPLAARPAGERGPQIRPGAFGGARPALRPAAVPANARPAGGGLAGRPGFGGGRPGEAPGAGAAGRGPAGGFGRAGEAPRAGGAPGPAIGRPGEAGARAGLPALRAARPGEAAPGVAHPGMAPGAGGFAGRGETRPGNAGAEAARPGLARPERGEAPGQRDARPGTATPGAEAGRPARGGEAARGVEPGRGGEPARGAGPARGVEPGRGGEPARGGEPGRGEPRPAAPGAARPGAAERAGEAHRAEAAPARRAAPAAAARPEREARPAAPREAAPRAAAPRAEPRPAPHPAAPRPAPHPAAAPRPAPHPAGPEHKK